MTKALVAAVVVLLIAATAGVRADDTAADPPWGRGVTAEQKARAHELLDQGNELFVHDDYAGALAKYKEAIASWDHPAIRFNMVRALIALDRPLEAADSLDKALAYGKAPLDDQLYAEALNYRTLLAGQLSTLEVSCTQDGVAVSVDGEAFVACPGTKTTRARPGAHVVVATRTGYLTTTRDVVLMPGAPTTVPMRVRSIAEATVMKTRWATWKPWAVVGAGVALAGIGGLVDLKARADLSDFDHDLDQNCQHTGCTTSQLGSLGSTALVENKLAIATMIAGGAVVATGVALAIVNRPQPFIPADDHPVVVPVATPGGAGVMVFGRF